MKQVVLLPFPALSVEFSLKAMGSLWKSLRKMRFAFFFFLKTRVSREAVWRQVETRRQAGKALRKRLGER